MNSEVVSNYVELVRENDTWYFLEEKEESARKLGMLFSIYNRDKYINKMIDNLKNSSSSIFTKEEEYLFEIEKIRMNDYIESSRISRPHLPPTLLLADLATAPPLNV